MSLVGALLGLGGFLSGNAENARERKKAEKAQKQQDEMLRRQQELQDMFLGFARGADKAGQFDPSMRLAQLDDDTARYEARDSGNLAGALRVAGYKAGDSEIGTRLDSVKVKYRGQREQMADQIRQQAFGQKMAAYGAANPGDLNPSIQVYGQRAQDARGRIGNPAGLLGAIMPFLQGGAGRKAPGTPTRNDAQSGGGFVMPTRKPVRYGMPDEDTY